MPFGATRQLSTLLLPAVRSALRNLSQMSKEDGEAEAERYRRTIWTFWLVGALPWPLIFAAIYGWTLESPQGMWICLTCFVAFMPVPRMLRRMRDPRLAGHWIVGVMTVALTGLGCITGGSGAPALVWLLAVPLIAMHVAGLRALLGWCVTAITILIAFDLLEKLGASPPRLLTQTHMHELASLGNIGVVVLIATLAGSYDALRRAAVKLANERQAQLAVALEQAKEHALQLAASAEALRASETLYRNLVQNSPMGMLFYELNERDELVLTRANPASDLLIGTNVQGRIGKKAEEAFPDLVDTGLLEHYRKAARDGVAWSTEGIEYDDGSVSGVFELRAFQTTPGKMVVVFMNITDRIRAAEAVRASEREIALQAGKAEVATDVLHNVGNALSRVKVSTSLMREKLRESEAPTLQLVAGAFKEHREDLPTFLSQDERGRALPAFLEQLSGLLANEQASLERELLGLTDSVDYIASIIGAQQVNSQGQSQIETVRPADVMEQAINMSLGGLHHAMIEVSREMEPLPAVPMHRYKVLQVLVNLLNNARQAMGAVEKPRIACGVRRAETPQGARVQWTVTDNGVGIEAENLEKLFTFGFTTRRDGHGFGLHSAANLAQEMGGRLHAASEGRGRGATFTLEIPMQTLKVST